MARITFFFFFKNVKYILMTINVDNIDPGNEVLVACNSLKKLIYLLRFNTS